MNASCGTEAHSTIRRYTTETIGSEGNAVGTTVSYHTACVSTQSGTVRRSVERGTVETVGVLRRLGQQCLVPVRKEALADRLRVQLQVIGCYEGRVLLQESRDESGASEQVD